MSATVGIADLLKLRLSDLLIAHKSEETVKNANYPTLANPTKRPT